MHKHNSKRTGFTIVELLVVIVVIGVLAAITIVSYTGISRQALVASIKSDLTNASKQLKLYNVVYGEYPSTLDGSNCPSAPTADTKYCFKLSGGNIRESYARPTQQSFVLIVRNGSIVYQITHDSTPTVPPIFAVGGAITEVGGVRTHTFGIECTSGSPCVITASLGGTVTASIFGSGGGGGVGSSCCGGTTLYGNNGGNSSVLHITNSATYISNGGGGGEPGYDPGDSCTGGSPGAAGGYQGLGSADLTSWTKSTSGGSPGGSGGGGCAPGGNGGSGGSLVGSLVVTSGQQLRIIVGAGGAGGYEAGYGIGGSAGSPGIVTISYPN